MYSKVTVEHLASIIDHTNLKPYASKNEIKKLCDDAVDFSFGGVCVSGSNVVYCKELLVKSDVKTISVIAFPLGFSTTESKLFEIKDAISKGTDEVDIVMNIASVRNNHLKEIEDEFSKIVKVADGKIVKIILETGYLTFEQIIDVCKIAESVSVDFVKTSTGFGPMGAFCDHVSIIRETVGSNVGVKAAGGIKDARTAVRLIDAGANRLGASASCSIIESLEHMNETGLWFSKSDDKPEEIYSWGKIDKQKLPSDVYNYYLSLKNEFYNKSV